MKLAFDTLSTSQNRLIGRIACFRTSITYGALQAIHGTGKGSNFLDETLSELETRGLLHWDRKTNKYDLHPIVRRYAYERLTVPDRVAAHARLRDYFASVETPAEPQNLDELAPVIELYHHTVRAGSYDDAYALYNDRLRGPLYYRFGAYELDLQSLLSIPRLENGLPHLSLVRNQTWNLYYAAMTCERMGRLQQGLSLVQQAIDLNRMGHYPVDLGATTQTLAIISCETGKLKNAITSSIESVKLLDTIDDANWHGISHRSYGRILTILGDFERADAEFEFARSSYKPKSRFRHGLSLLAIYEGQERLWQKRPQEAFKLAEQARYLSGQHYIRESISADWLSGLSLIDIYANRPFSQSSVRSDIEHFLHIALTRCHQINLVELEADILLAIARWHCLKGEKQQALMFAKNALDIADRCGYRLKQADIHNFLALHSLEQERDQVKAKEYAETALRYAYCDGPPYYYHVAYQEAVRILEQLK